MALKRKPANGLKKLESTLDNLHVLQADSKAELLLILIVLEQVAKKETLIPIELFTVFDFDAIAGSIDSYHDSGSAVEWVIDFLRSDWLENGIEVITLKNLCVETNMVLPEALHALIDFKDETKNEDGIYAAAAFFSELIENYQKVLIAKKFEVKFDLENHSIDYNLIVPFDDSPSLRELLPLLAFAPKSVSVEWKYNASKASEYKKTIADSLLQIDRGKQLEAFYRYISTLHPVNDKIFVPFSTLGNTSFNIVQILWFLDWNKDIEVKSWTGNDSWEAKLISDRLLSIYNPHLSSHQLPRKLKVEKVKFEYDKKSQSLRINGIQVPVTQSQYQCHLLEVLIDEKPVDEDLGFAEIGNIVNHYSDSEDAVTLRTRYCNAANQLRKKIAAETGVKDIFKTSRQLIRFNPRYTFEFGLS